MIGSDTVKYNVGRYNTEQVMLESISVMIPRVVVFLGFQFFEEGEDISIMGKADKN